MTVGFAIYLGMQYEMGSLIGRLWWWYIVAFFIITGSIALAAAKPTAAFLTWLIVSPFGARFLGLQYRWSALPVLTFDLIVVYSLAVILVARALLHRTQPRKPAWAEVFMLLTPIYIAIYRIVSSQELRFSGILRFFTRLWLPEALFVVVLYFTAKACIRKKEHISWFMVSVVAVGLLMALIAFYEHYTGNRWYSLIVGFGIPLRWQDVGEGRASGMFDSVSAPAVLVATSLFFAYHLAGWTRKWYARVFYYVTMALMICGAYFTYTRNVYATVVMFALLMPFFSVERRARFAVSAILLLLGIGIVAPIMLSNATLYRRLTSTRNVYSRLASADTFVNMFKHNMWFGVGWGNADKRVFEYVTSLKHPGGRARGVSWKDNAHNTYITVLAEQGVVGAILYFGAMAAFIVHLLRLRKRRELAGFFGKDLVSLFIVSSLCYMVSIVSWSNHIVRYPNYAFWIQLAVMVRLSQVLDDEAADARTEGELQIGDAQDQQLLLQRSA